MKNYSKKLISDHNSDLTREELAAKIKELSEKNKQLDFIIKNSSDFTFILNKNLFFIGYYQNKNYLKLFVPPKFFIGKKINDIGFPKNTLKKLTNAIKMCISLNEKVIIEYNLTIQNEKRWFRANIFNFLNSENNLEIYCLVNDITDKKNILDELSKSEKRFRTLIGNIDIGILVQDINSKIIISNNASLSLLGLTKEQLLGKSSFDENWNIIHEDGSNFPSHEHPLPVCIRTCKPVNNIIMGVFRPISNDRVWLFVNAQPNFSANGILENVICTFQDITKRKESEEKIKERTSQLFNANQELESFSYSVSHDLKAPLRVINGYAKILEEDYFNILDNYAKDLIKSILWNSNYMGLLIKNLLDFSKLGKQNLSTTFLNMDNLIEEICSDLITNELKNRLELKISKLHSINADYILIKQVWVNLILNALKFSNKKENQII